MNTQLNTDAYFYDIATLVHPGEDNIYVIKPINIFKGYQFKIFSPIEPDIRIQSIELKDTTHDNDNHEKIELPIPAYLTDIEEWRIPTIGPHQRLIFNFSNSGRNERGFMARISGIRIL